MITIESFYNQKIDELDNLFSNNEEAFYLGYIFGRLNPKEFIEFISGEGGIVACTNARNFFLKAESAIPVGMFFVTGYAYATKEQTTEKVFQHPAKNIKTYLEVALDDLQSDREEAKKITDRPTVNHSEASKTLIEW